MNCVLVIYIYGFLFSARCWFIGWGELKGTRRFFNLKCARVGELGAASKADHPVVSWAGQLSGVSCLQQLTAICGNEVIKGWGSRLHRLSFEFSGWVFDPDGSGLLQNNFYIQKSYKSPPKA